MWVAFHIPLSRSVSVMLPLSLSSSVSLYLSRHLRGAESGISGGICLRINCAHGYCICTSRAWHKVTGDIPRECMDCSNAYSKLSGFG